MSKLLLSDAGRSANQPLTPLPQLAPLPKDPANGLTGPLNITLHPLSRTFHPLLRLSISRLASTPKPATTGCYNMIQILLPDEVFVDKDELSDRWGMKQAILRPFSDHPSKATMKSEESKVDQSGMGLVAWTITPDIIDIERVARTEPVYITNRAGDLVEERVRLTLALEIRDEVAEVIVPLHGRYLAPGKELGLGRWWGRRNEKEVVVFGEGGGEIRGSWQCALSEDPERIFALPPPFAKPPTSSSSPDSNAENVVISHTPNSTCFSITIAQTQNPIIESPDGPITLILPIGTASHQIPVEIITVLVVWCGWAYLVRKIWRFRKRAMEPGHGVGDVRVEGRTAVQGTGGPIASDSGVEGRDKTE